MVPWVELQALVSCSPKELRAFIATLLPLRQREVVEGATKARLTEAPLQPRLSKQYSCAQQVLLSVQARFSTASWESSGEEKESLLLAELE